MVACLSWPGGGGGEPMGAAPLYAPPSPCPRLWDFGTNAPTLLPGVRLSPYSQLLSRDERRKGCGPHHLLSLPGCWFAPAEEGEALSGLASAVFRGSKLAQTGLPHVENQRNPSVCSCRFLDGSTSVLDRAGTASTADAGQSSLVRWPAP